MQLQVSAVEKGRKGHMLCANNPIFLISAGGVQMNRILFAGLSSGSGKTAVTCACLRARRKKESLRLRLSADQTISIRCSISVCSAFPGENLDLFFADAKTLQRQIACYEQRCKIAVLEGVMGYYDGLGGVSDRDSTWDVACATNTPVILVVRPKGASLTIAAQVQGMLSFRKRNQLAGFCSMAVRKGWRGCLHRCWRNRPDCGCWFFALCGRCFF